MIRIFLVVCLSIALVLSACGQMASGPNGGLIRGAGNGIGAGTVPALIAGCGAGPLGALIYDQSTCGNYAGAPYEDLNTASSLTAPATFGSGTVINISACTSFASTVQGNVYRFTADVNDGAGGTNQSCISFPAGGSNYVVDMNGHSLTGGMQWASGGFSGVSVVNGTITCNIATGGIAACLLLEGSGNPSKSVLLSHLTISNINSPTNPDPVHVTVNSCDGTSHSQAFCGFEYALYIEADGSANVNCSLTLGADQKLLGLASCIEVTHVTTSVASGYTGVGYTVQWCNRCQNIWLAAAGGGSFEVWNTLTNCGGFIDACQGIVAFDVFTKNIHHNNAPWTRYVGAGDNGRAILFDSAGKTFNAAGGAAYNNNFATINSRCFRTRDESNIKIHDNFCDSSTILEVGANDDYSENDGGTEIYNNTIKYEGGSGVRINNSYGVIIDHNQFVCGSGCTNVTLLSGNDIESLVKNVSAGTRDAACNVTLTVPPGFSTTSPLGGLFINISGTGTDFDINGTAGIALTSRSGSTFNYVQTGCAGANSFTIGSPSCTLNAATGALVGQCIWFAATAADNFAANGSDFYVHDNTFDAGFSGNLMTACGLQGNPNSCTSGFQPMSAFNGGQNQIHHCNNTQNGSLITPVGGTGALVIHRTPDNACPASSNFGL